MSVRHACLLTPSNRVLLEKLITSQVAKKFTAFYGTRRFITSLTRARHLSLSWTRSIQSMASHPTSWIFILILSSHLRLGLPSGLFPSGFPTKPLCTFPLTSPWRGLLTYLPNVCLITPNKYLFTYSMEQSPAWEANRFSASQEIPRNLWNPKVHYRHLSLSWARSIHSISPHPTSWRFILILSSHLRLGLPCDLLPSTKCTIFIHYIYLVR